MRLGELKSKTNIISYVLALVDILTNKSKSKCLLILTLKGFIQAVLMSTLKGVLVFECYIFDYKVTLTCSRQFGGA